MNRSAAWAAVAYVHDDGTVRFGFAQPKESMLLLRDLAAEEPAAFERLSAHGAWFARTHPEITFGCPRNPHAAAPAASFPISKGHEVTLRSRRMCGDKRPCEKIPDRRRGRSHAQMPAIQNSFAAPTNRPSNGLTTRPCPPASAPRENSLTCR